MAILSSLARRFGLPSFTNQGQRLATVVSDGSKEMTQNLKSLTYESLLSMVEALKCTRQSLRQSAENADEAIRNSSAFRRKEVHQLSGPPKSLVGEALDAVFSEKGWKLETEQDGVEVSSRIIRGSRLKQIRGRGVLKADADSVLRLFQSSSVSKIKEFNPMYANGKDLVKINGHTKISWSKTHSAPFVAPRDFVTFVQMLRTRQGDIIILNKSTDHPDCPRGLNGCVRGTMYLGANCVRPGKNKGECEFTFVQHVDVGGSVPAWVMNKVMLSDSVSFVKRVEKAAQSPYPAMAAGRFFGSLSKDDIQVKPRLI